jgi:type I restriction enzyme S subunit
MMVFPEHWEGISLKEAVYSVKGKKPKNLWKIKAKGAVPYIDIKAFEKKEIRQYADIQSSNIAEEN